MRAANNRHRQDAQDAETNDVRRTSFVFENSSLFDDDEAVDEVGFD